jgi:hypothetical protein
MKKFFAGEIAKLREMNFTDKRQYIWEYYKLHIIGTAIAAILIGSIINALFINPPARTYLYIAWIEVPSNMERLFSLADALGEEIIGYEYSDRYEIHIFNYTATGDFAHDTAIQTRFAVSIQIQDIDVVLTTAQGMYESSGEGFLRCVRQLLPAVPQAETRLREFGEVSVASLAGSPFMAEHGFTSDDMYFALFVNGRRHEAAAAALGVLLDGAE